jgi:hypothetical protein
MEHHQIAVLALQFFFVGFDLHLPWHWPLLFHRLLLLLGFLLHGLFEGITAVPLALARIDSCSAGQRPARQQSA